MPSWLIKGTSTGIIPFITGTFNVHWTKPTTLHNAAPAWTKWKLNVTPFLTTEAQKWWNIRQPYMIWFNWCMLKLVSPATKEGTYAMGIGIGIKIMGIQVAVHIPSPGVVLRCHNSRKSKTQEVAINIPIWRYLYIYFMPLAMMPEPIRYFTTRENSAERDPNVRVPLQNKNNIEDAEKEPTSPIIFGNKTSNF